MSEVAPDAAEAAPDPAIADAEESLRWLKEMGETGMEQIRGLKNLPADGSGGKDPADAFVKLTRVVRLTIVLRAKTHAQLRDLRAGAVEDRDLKRIIADLAGGTTRRAPDIDHEMQMRECRIASRVHDVILAESLDKETREDLTAALEERLEEDEAYEGAVDEPVREVVERLCRDLDLHPDWSQWEGDGWAPGYVPVRPHDSPFNQPSRKPLLCGDSPRPVDTPANPAAFAPSG